MSVVNAAATDDAILTCDSGTIATWAARHRTIRGDVRARASWPLSPAPGPVLRAAGGGAPASRRSRRT